MILSPGTILGGKYRIVRLVGDGGMGSVYEARHQVLGSMVALKFLHPELARRAGLAERFLREARAAAAIQSAHVARVTDVDRTSDGAPFLVMEFLNGESLQSLLDREHKLPGDQAVDFALQILAGLEAAHAAGVVHRDLKPDNVFVTPTAGGPLLKLIDFGIAKLRADENRDPKQKPLTRTGALMGTPEYMAPEQLYSAASVDHRADLYSLGVLLYEMLTGARPVEGDEAVHIVTRVMQGSITPICERNPSVPEGLAALVHRAMAPEPEQRFADAFEFRHALAAFAGELSHAGKLAASLERFEPEPSRALSAEDADQGAEQPSANEPGPGAGAEDTEPPAPPHTLSEPMADSVAARGSDTQAAPAFVAPMALLPTARASHPAPNIRVPRRRRGRRLLLTLLGVLLLAGAGVAALALTRPKATVPDLPPPPWRDAGLPEARISSEAPPQTTRTFTPPQVTPVPNPPTRAPARDAGARDAAAGDKVAPFPFAIPSTFTIPSSLPELFPSGLPSTFPTALPSNLPFPWGQPAQAQPGGKDGG
jgi:serine/threonine-protein kinase